MQISTKHKTLIYIAAFTLGVLIGVHTKHVPVSSPSPCLGQGYR